MCCAVQHLRNFYVIIPPLILSYVDHMLVAKDRMGKKGKFGCFTDDGFAIGIAYVLSVLRQNEKFESLHWFDSVTDEFRRAEQELSTEIAAGRAAGGGGGAADEKQAQHALRLRKLRHRKVEFDLLYYAFNGARIFFRGHE